MPTLLAKASRTPAEEARLKELDARIEAGNGEVSAFFRNTLYTQLAHKVGTEDANALLSKEKSDVSRLQNTLAELGPRVLGIRLLLGEEHAYAIVVTPHTREKVELKATPADLRSKVLQVRDDLRTPTSDPKPHLYELYAMVVAPLGPQLAALEGRAGQDRVPTLLWSLDGVLRYLPMAALYDGKHYMAERFNNVLFTPESYGHMTAASTSGLRVLAMGLTKSYGGLPALPGVMPELEAVVRDPAVPQSHGPMDGRLLPDEQFTLAALKTQLGGSFPVVHIASHFVLESGEGEEPYLMLGGDNVGGAEGYALTLSKMEDSTISFHGTQLLTLSACSTAKGDAAKDGLEMDSLGMIAQQKDAAAVLATLWDVNDASTSRLMSDFYSRWVKVPADGKAEALRQAQLAFLHGSGFPDFESGARQQDGAGAACSKLRSSVLLGAVCADRKLSMNKNQFVTNMVMFLCLNLASSLAAALPASCSASQLSLGLDQEGGSFDGMSHSGTLLVVRNLGPQDCSVAALPGLAFEDAQHHPVHVSLQAPSGMHPGPVILPVVIPAGAEVTGEMRWVSGDVYDGHNCVSPAYMTVPVGAASLSVQFNGTLCGPAGPPPTYTMTPLQRDPAYTPTP